MNEIAELARRVDRAKVERARAMSLTERFRAGAELFEEACEVSRPGIRNGTKIKWKRNWSGDWRSADALKPLPRDQRQ